MIVALIDIPLQPIRTDCPLRRAALKSHGEVLSRNLFELRDGSAQRVLRRLAVAFSSGVSRRSGAQGLLGVGQDPPLTRQAGETAGLSPALAGHGLPATTGSAWIGGYAPCRAGLDSCGLMFVVSYADWRVTPSANRALRDFSFSAAFSQRASILASARSALRR
jgi:hypothetical protein